MTILYKHIQLTQTHNLRNISTKIVLKCSIRYFLNFLCFIRIIFYLLLPFLFIKIIKIINIINNIFITWNNNRFFVYFILQITLRLFKKNILMLLRNFFQNFIIKILILIQKINNTKRKFFFFLNIIQNIII